FLATPIASRTGWVVTVCSAMIDRYGVTGFLSPRPLRIGGRLLARPLAGYDLFLGIGGPVRDRDRDRPFRVERRIGGFLQPGLALVGGVVPDLRLDQDGLAVRLLAVEDLQRQRDARAADGAGVGNRGAGQAL